MRNEIFPIPTSVINHFYILGFFINTNLCKCNPGVIVSKVLDAKIYVYLLITSRPPPPTVALPPNHNTKPSLTPSPLPPSSPQLLQQLQLASTYIFKMLNSSHSAKLILFILNYCSSTTTLQLCVYYQFKCPWGVDDVWQTLITYVIQSEYFLSDIQIKEDLRMFVSNISGVGCSLLRPSLWERRQW